MLVSRLIGGCHEAARLMPRRLLHLEFLFVCLLGKPFPVPRVAGTDGLTVIAISGVHCFGFTSSVFGDVDGLALPLCHGTLWDARRMSLRPDSYSTEQRAQLERLLELMLAPSLSQRVFDGYMQSVIIVMSASFPRMGPGIM